MAVFDFGVIVFCSLIILYAGSKFADASSKIGDYYNLPKSVKGVTLDAVSSSAPEFFIAVFSVIAFGYLELGIGTIVGSALFNFLLIPAMCIIISRKRVKLGKEVVYREGAFYAASVMLLLLALFFLETWGFFMAFVFIFCYFAYLYVILKNTRGYWKKTKTRRNKVLGLKNEVIIFLISLVLIGVATYFLTDHSINFAEELNVPPVLIGFTVVAIATSLPDGIISMVNARKGSMDDAISNTLGSNIFNILAGLSIPVLLNVIILGPVEIFFEHFEVLIGLLIVTVALPLMMIKNRVLTPGKAVLLLIIFFLFQAYFVYLAVA